jgi:Uncharacterized protein related to plant photosystem II stability/assembly factor
MRGSRKHHATGQYILPMIILMFVIVVGFGSRFGGGKKEVSSEDYISTVTPTVMTPTLTPSVLPTPTVIPTSMVLSPTIAPISNDNKTESENNEQNSIQDIYTQLKEETSYKIVGNKLSISYDDGKSYTDTQLEIPQENGTIFNCDNIFINDDVTAVVIPKNSTADIYVSKDRCKTWSKTTLKSKEKDHFITEPTYNPPTLSFVSAFIGFRSNSNGWIAFGGDVAMGHENNFVFQTSDGGKTWNEVNNASNVYAHVLTGACYANADSGFLCFRYDTSNHGPIYSTYDGGKSWKEIQIEYPSEYSDIGLTPVSPRFSGKYGIIPMCSADYVDYNKVAFYLYTKDGGKTWSNTMPK